MMVRAKRIYILIVKVNKLFSFYSSRCFLKEIENTFSVFLSSYRNTRESLGELEKAVKHSPAARVPTAFNFLPNFHSCFYNSIETRRTCFLFLKYTCIVAGSGEVIILHITQTFAKWGGGKGWLIFFNMPF